MSGQLPTRDLIALYRVRHTTPGTAVYGVTGSPLGHSASPAIHNALFAHTGLDALYVPLETADAQEFLDVADAIGLAGASVTVPLKTALLPAALPGDELASQIGAINTLRRGPRGWESRNFDVAGFLAPLDRHADTFRKGRAVVLGAGGAARAAVWALKARGARVEVSARRPEQAAALAAEFRVKAIDWPPAPGWDLLVNTTPVGMWPHVDDTPLEPSLIQGPLVYDLVYNPPETRLLRLAREAGAETIGGLEMLVNQASRQFEWWTGRKPALSVAEKAAQEFVERRGP